MLATANILVIELKPRLATNSSLSTLPSAMLLASCRLTNIYCGEYFQWYIANDNISPSPSGHISVQGGANFLTVKTTVASEIPQSRPDDGMSV